MRVQPGPLLRSACACRGRRPPRPRWA